MTEKADCRHREDREGDIGTCIFCGQQTQYYPGGIKPPVIIKAGVDPDPVRSGEANPATETQLGEGDMTSKARVTRDELLNLLENLKSNGGDTTEVEGLLAQVDAEEAGKNPGGRPTRKIRKATAAERERNKEAMLADFYSISTTDFLNKWHISTQTWKKLKIQWKVTSKGMGRRREKPPAPDKPDTPQANPAFPVFPEFNDQWNPDAQRAWFTAYVRLGELKQMQGRGG